MPRGAEVPASADARSELAEIQALIAAADAGVKEATQETRAVEEKKTRKKKQVAEEGLASAEVIEDILKDAAASDPLVGTFQYEEFFEVAQHETGIAPPVHVKELARALREAHAAIERLGSAPVNEKVAAAIRQLVEKRASLFDGLRKIAYEHLERIKNKYKGEKDELETVFSRLEHSPLAKGIEYDPNGPEAREMALKQELTELMLRPVMDNRMKEMEKSLELRKRGLLEFSRQFEEVKKEDVYFQGRASSLIQAYRLPVTTARGEEFQRWIVENEAEKKLKALKSEVESMESFVAQQRRGIEANALIIRNALEGVHDEAELREALNELRTFLDFFRVPFNQRYNHFDAIKPVPEVKNRLARKLYGEYMTFGVTLGEVPYEVQSVIPDPQISWSPGVQLLGGARESNNPNGSFSVNMLALGDSMYEREALDGETLDLWTQNRLFPQALDQLLMDVMRTSREGVKGSDEDLAKKLCAGKGELINNRFAFLWIQGQKQFKIPLLPKVLEKVGWTLSRSGAWVEPGEDPILVEKKFQNRLDELSKPLAEAEFMFDTPNAEGRFQIFTIRQATDLLARARRDATEMVKDIAAMRKDAQVAQAEAQKNAKETAASGLQEKIAGLTEELKGMEKGLAASQKNAERLKIDKMSETAKKLAAKKEASSAQDELAKRDAQMLVLIQALHTALNGSKGPLGGKFQTNVESAITTAKSSLPPELMRRLIEMTEGE